MHAPILLHNVTGNNDQEMQLYGLINYSIESLSELGSLVDWPRRSLWLDENSIEIILFYFSFARIKKWMNKKVANNSRQPTEN